MTTMRPKKRWKITEVILTVVNQQVNQLLIIIESTYVYMSITDSSEPEYDISRSVSQSIAINQSINQSITVAHKGK